MSLSRITGGETKGQVKESQIACFSCYVTLETLFMIDPWLWKIPTGHALLLFSFSPNENQDAEGVSATYSHCKLTPAAKFQKSCRKGNTLAVGGIMCRGLWAKISFQAVPNMELSRLC